MMRRARRGAGIRTSDARTREVLTELLRRGWVKVAVDAAGGDSSLVCLTDSGAEALAWAEELLLGLSQAMELPRRPVPDRDAIDDPWQLHETKAREHCTGSQLMIECRRAADDRQLSEAALHARGRAAGVADRPSDDGFVGSSSYCAGYVVGSNARLGVLGMRARGTLEAFARDSSARHRAEAVAAALCFVAGGPPLEGHHEVALRAFLDSPRSLGWRDDLRDLLAVVSFKTGGPR